MKKILIIEDEVKIIMTCGVNASVSDVDLETGANKFSSQTVHKETVTRVHS